MDEAASAGLMLGCVPERTLASATFSAALLNVNAPSTSTSVFDTIAATPHYHHHIRKLDRLLPSASVLTPLAVIRD